MVCNLPGHGPPPGATPCGERSQKELLRAASNMWQGGEGGFEPKSEPGRHEQGISCSCSLPRMAPRMLFEILTPHVAPKC